MDHAIFARALGRLSVDDIRALARDLDALMSSPADDVAVTRATLRIEQAVRRLHRQPEAGIGALAASHAVVDAAERQGLELPDPDVTRVARAAAQLARGLVVAEAAGAEVKLLAMPWSRLPESVAIAAITAA